MLQVNPQNIVEKSISFRTLFLNSDFNSLGSLKFVPKRAYCHNEILPKNPKETNTIAAGIIHGASAK